MCVVVVDVVAIVVAVVAVHIGAVDVVAIVVAAVVAVHIDAVNVVVAVGVVFTGKAKDLSSSIAGFPSHLAVVVGEIDGSI